MSPCGLYTNLAPLIEAFWLFVWTYFGNHSRLPFKHECFSCNAVLPVPIHKPRDFPREEPNLKPPPIPHNHMHFTPIAPRSTIQPNNSNRNQIPIHSKLLPFHIKGTDWRMMTDLFIIEWNSPHPALESLPQNGIERFQHYQLQCIHRANESDQWFHLRQWVQVAHTLQVLGYCAERGSTSLQQRSRLKNIDGKWDIEHRLAIDKISPNLFQHIDQTVFLPLN